MPVPANSAYYAEFTTSNPTTGAAQNGDSLPVATATHNGVDDASFTLTVTNLATGRYKATGTVPAGYAAGDYVQVSVAATVATIAGVGVIDNFTIGPAVPTAAQVATAIWQDATAGDFTVASSIGKALYTGPPTWYTAPTTPPTTTQIATAVWQDATAGDFTVASSIGKSLYIANVVPGAAGGHFIAGANAATTVNFTGNLSGSVGSVTGAVGSVTGAVGSVTAAVTISTAQVLGAPRALDAIADGSITINDALWSAVGSGAGKEDASSGTTMVVKTPSTGTTLRTFTITTAGTNPFGANFPVSRA